MEYHMEQLPEHMQYWFPTAEPIITNPYGTTSADYMNNLTVYDNSCVMSTQSPIEYQHPHLIMDAPLSPCSPHTPTTPMSASYSPQPEFDQYMNSGSSVTSSSSRTLDNTCPHAGCTSKGKFKRRTDLTRHIKTQHEAEQNRIDCQHKWCGRVGAHGFSRRDHLREHLREVHQEKIPYKRLRRASGNRSPSKKEVKQEFPGSAPLAIPQFYRR